MGMVPRSKLMDVRDLRGAKDGLGNGYALVRSEGLGLFGVLGDGWWDSIRSKGWLLVLGR